MTSQDRKKLVVSTNLAALKTAQAFDTAPSHAHQQT